MIDSHQPITADEFLERVKNGQKVFEGFYIGDFTLTLRDKNFDDLVFHHSFVLFSFQNCSFKNTVFNSCNLKTITFENCDMSGACIMECAIESIIVKDCLMEGFMCGTNYAYGGIAKGYIPDSTPLNYKSFIGHFLQKVPEFQEIFCRHLKEHDREFLAHVLFGDFTRFVIKQFADSEKNLQSKDTFLRCLEFVEDLLATRDKELIDLVQASFLENLHEPGGEDYFRLVKLMMPYFKSKTLDLVRLEEYL